MHNKLLEFIVHLSLTEAGGFVEWQEPKDLMQQVITVLFIWSILGFSFLSIWGAVIPADQRDAWLDRYFSPKWKIWAAIFVAGPAMWAMAIFVLGWAFLERRR